MKCPIDQTALAITERQGVEIDYCPDCRGVWLDRGELDKIIDKAEGAVQAPSAPQPRAQSPEPFEQSRRHDDRNQHYDQPYKKKKRESFIGDLFDF